MKKFFPKLVVRHETIRTLATLELARAVGGDTAVMAVTDTCKEMCTSDIVVKPKLGG